MEAQCFLPLSSEYSSLRTFLHGFFSFPGEVGIILKLSGIPRIPTLPRNFEYLKIQVVTSYWSKLTYV